MNTPMDGFLDGMDDDLDPNAGQHARPDLGKGLYILSKLYPKNTFKKGIIVIAELAVHTPAPGSQRKPGELVSISYMTSYKGPSGMADRYAKARLRDFTRALLGLPEKTDTAPQAAKLMQADQKGRGILIAITGEKNGEYMNYTYEHVAGQSQQTIIGFRQKLDAAGYQPTVPAAAPQPTAPPQNTAFNPFGGAAPAQPAQPAAPAFDPFGGGNTGGGGFGGFGGGGDIPF